MYWTNQKLNRENGILYHHLFWDIFGIISSMSLSFFFCWILAVCDQLNWGLISKFLFVLKNLNSRIRHAHLTRTSVERTFYDQPFWRFGNGMFLGGFQRFSAISGFMKKASALFFIQTVLPFVSIPLFLSKMSSTFLKIPLLYLQKECSTLQPLKERWPRWFRWKWKVEFYFGMLSSGIFPFEEISNSKKIPCL